LNDGGLGWKVRRNQAWTWADVVISWLPSLNTSRTACDHPQCWGGPVVAASSMAWRAPVTPPNRVTQGERSLQIMPGCERVGIPPWRSCPANRGDGPVISIQSPISKTFTIPREGNWGPGMRLEYFGSRSLPGSASIRAVAPFRIEAPPALRTHDDATRVPASAPALPASVPNGGAASDGPPPFSDVVLRWG